MVQLIKIGNSQGVRIPKPLVAQAQLEGKELEFKLVNEGILIRPEKVARQGWSTKIDQLLEANGSEPTDGDWLELPLTGDNDLEW